MENEEHHNLEEVQFIEKKKNKYSGCIKILIVLFILAIIGFSVCLATFSLDTK